MRTSHEAACAAARVGCGCSHAGRAATGRAARMMRRSAFTFPEAMIRPAFDPRHMRDIRGQLFGPMRSQDPVVPAARARQRSPQFFLRARIEAVEHLVEQQHASVAGECARNQRQAALAVRQASACVACAAHRPNRCSTRATRSPLRARRLGQRNVLIEQAGRHHLRDREIPAVADVLVLALRPDVRDVFLARRRAPFPVQAYQRRSRPVGVGHTSPRSIFNSSVLPEPFGPTSAQRSPRRRRSRSSSSTT